MGTKTLTIVLAVFIFASTQAAQANNKFAAISVDAHNGKVLFARNADARRYPASLTKIMTLYVLFEEIKKGRFKLSSKLKVSRHGSRRPPSKLYLKPGQTIKVEHAILALVTKSANDVAATVGENISGSESAFARRMTSTARRLGMSRTQFRNASGLPDSKQYTTARDMATLGLRIQKDFPRYYRYFKTKRFRYKGKSYRNHNRLLGRYRGVDGIKTGYIRASGFNLTASVRRPGKHVVAVVMGGRSGKSRNNYMVQVLNKALKKVPKRRGVGLASSAGSAARNTNSNSTNFATQPARKKTSTKAVTATDQPVIGGTQPLATPTAAQGSASSSNSWNIQIGAFANEAQARARLVKVQKRGFKVLRGKQIETKKYTKGYRARFTGFSSKSAASKACSTLKKRSIDCFTVAPQG
ncbi:MAG: SPOR domain-containing protein [Hyphomicrobiales bacterium]